MHTSSGPSHPPLSSHMNERGGLTTTLVFLLVSNLVQSGHDNWLRALVFHPNGKYLLSASDDKTIRVWDLVSGRCTKTVEAHGHFVTCLSWGRALVSGGGADEGANGTGEKVERRVNVIATGSVDQTVKVRLPVSLVSIRLELICFTRRCGCPSGLDTMSPARLQRILRPVSFASGATHSLSFFPPSPDPITDTVSLASNVYSPSPFPLGPHARPSRSRFLSPPRSPCISAPLLRSLRYAMCFALVCLYLRLDLVALQVAALHEESCPVGRPTPVCPLPLSPRTATSFPFS
jgi:hypothetical protein